jgi:hypothetical protein
MTKDDQEFEGVWDMLQVHILRWGFLPLAITLSDMVFHCCQEVGCARLTGAWQVFLSITLLGGLNKDMLVISHFTFMSTSWMKLRDCRSFLEVETIPSILLPVQRASGAHRSVFGLKPDLSLWWLLISAS